jgi:hypothetical protein
VTGRRLLAALLAALALAAASCGFGEGEEREAGVQLRVTRDFGQERIYAARVERVREDESVMRLLRDRREVETSYGGRFVSAIDGLARSGRQRDWFYWVNGIEASVGAAEYRLHAGDVVQWDLRDWSAAMRVPAIVGAWPEPFRSGAEGKRLPVRLQCEDSDSTPCREAGRRLEGAGAVVTRGALAAGGRSEVVRVLVGRWPALRRIRVAAVLEGAPDQSGVFARFADGGRRLELLDPEGQVARTAPPGTGLVAAVSGGELDIAWVLTGREEAGVAAAVRSLDVRTLRDAFAVAATPSGVLRLPLEAGG